MEQYLDKTITKDITELKAGTYSVTIKDKFQLHSIDSTFTLTEPDLAYRFG